MPQRNPAPVQVLFVCLGNICRSPTAEGIFRQLVRERGLTEQIRTDSCGTGDWHRGDPPDARAQAEALAREVDISDLRGRQVARTDFAAFDYILAMDDDNFSNLRRMCPPEYTERLYRAVSFAPDLGADEVPDPYYGGQQGFAKVYDLLTAICEGLLARIKAERGIE